jgi:hypothetical protein
MTITGTGKKVRPRRGAIIQLRRLVSATFSVTLVAAAAISPNAQSATVASPVGKYSALILPLNAPAYVDSLDLKQSSAFLFKQGPRGSWSESNGVITMTGRYERVTFVFVINQLGNNLGARTERGTITEGGHPFGKWVAKRV